MRFRWVRKRVKIVSRDESWPEKERQAKGQKMHSKISLFSNFLFGFTGFFFFPQTNHFSHHLHGTSDEQMRKPESTGLQGDGISQMSS